MSFGSSKTAMRSVSLCMQEMASLTNVTLCRSTGRREHLVLGHLPRGSPSLTKGQSARLAEVHGLHIQSGASRLNGGRIFLETSLRSPLQRVERDQKAYPFQSLPEIRLKTVERLEELGACCVSLSPGNKPFRASFFEQLIAKSRDPLICVHPVAGSRFGSACFPSLEQEYV